MFQSIGRFIVSVALGAAALLGYHQTTLNGVVYAPVPRYESSLALALTSTQTSTMNLVSGVDGNGMTLSGPTCFTIDSGVANSVEDVCGTASGTVVSNLIRGVDSSGYNGSSTLAKAHRVGADVKITDSPYLAQMAALLNGTQGLPNTLSYSSHPTTTASTTIEDKAYMDALAIAGAPNGSTSSKGIYQEATQAQLAAGNATGSTGADLIVPNLFSSRTASTSPVNVIASGTLDPSFLSNGTYSLGSLTSASTTLNGSTTLPITNGLLTTNGSGTVVGLTGATTGTVLQYYNGKWNAGLQQILGTSAVSVPASTSSIISTTTFPLASASSIYDFSLTFSVPATPSGATSTIFIANGNSSTTLAVCGESNDANAMSGTIAGRIILQGATTAEVAYGGFSVGGHCSLVTNFTIVPISYNFATTTYLQDSVKTAGASGPQTWLTTTTIEMIQ